MIILKRTDGLSIQNYTSKNKVSISDMKIIFVWIIIIFALPVVQGKASDLTKCLGKIQKITHIKPRMVKLIHATGYNVYKAGKIKLVQVYRSRSKRNSHFLYLLSPRKIDCPNTTWIKTPVKRFVALSTTHLPPLMDLDLIGALKGFGNTKSIYNKRIRHLVNKGEIRDVGFPANPEIVLSIKPDFVMAHIMEASDVEGLKRLEKLGIPVVYNGDYKESHPLARAEWMRFMSLFFDKEKEALKIYENIKSSYEMLKRKVGKLKRPRILVGMNVNGIWEAPSGSSDLAVMIEDAGGHYIWKNFKKTERLMMSIEKVWPQVEQVDIWLTQNTWKNLAEVIGSDRRYGEFNVLKRQNIFNNNRKLNEYGGNDYWETALMRPDLLLKDLANIFHPGIFQGHRPVWYHKLVWNKK